MPASVALFTAFLTLGGCHDRPKLLARGADLATGVLLNLTPGAIPGQPLDPARPTVVFIHGFNPLPRAVHFTMAERLAESLQRRGQPAFNILAWDWNAATFTRLGHRANAEQAVAQGRSLANSLCAAGVVPGRTQLIAHSAGGIVAASAAWCFAVEQGQPLAQVTFLDPAACSHKVVFDRLRAHATAGRVENFWAPGPSGYGKAVEHPGVWNTRVPGPRPYFGSIWPLQSSHLFVVEWYLGTIEDPSYPGGFNTSVLLRP